MGDAELGAEKLTPPTPSAVHYYIHGRNGEYVLRDPMALGHESAGIIVSAT